MKTTILGGGIAGLMAAIALKKAGVKATVFEAAPEIKPLGAGLALAANAIQALRELGIADDIIAKGRVLPSFALLKSNGKVIHRTDSLAIGNKYGLDNFTIARADLHNVLLSKLEGEDIVTGKRATGYSSLPNGRIEVKFADGTTHETDVLIVADGIHSPIRKQLVPGSDLRYAGYTCWRGLIDNSQLSLNETSETWGTKGRFGIVPLANNKLYWFAVLNAKMNDPVLRSYKPADLLKHFGDYHSPVPDIIRQTREEQLLWNDIFDIKPINKYAFGNIVLIGDAAHATTPNMGQGACQAIEDAVVLGNMMKAHKDPAQAFIAFEKKRLARTHYIVNNSRMIGTVAQLQNPFLASIRNFMFKLVSASAIKRQTKKLFNVDLRA